MLPTIDSRNALDSGQIAIDAPLPNVVSTLAPVIHSVVKLASQQWNRLMARYIGVANKAKDSSVFREIAQELFDLLYSDWTDWEWNWLRAMLRYPETYAHSETEREKLAQLYWLSELCYGHDGRSVQEMIVICYRYHVDFDECDSDFIVGLHNRDATSVRRRELRWLIRLCRESGEDLRAA
jgi:hypothetical protein